MNIMPINSVKFGELYHQNVKYTIPQKYLLRDIEAAFDCTVPSDKYERSYRSLINAKGYDILLSPFPKNAICVNVLGHPRNDKDKYLKAHNIFEMPDEKTRVGVYDKKHPFNVNDVLNTVDSDIKRSRNYLISMLAFPAMLAAVILGAAWGISKIPVSKNVEKNLIENFVQDSTKVAKDTISLFK